MSRDFQNAKIYKITNDYNNDVYIGSTCDTLIKRYIKHKSKMKTECSKLYECMNKIGIERFRIELIENYPCEDKYQLLQRETHWIREMGTLNQRPSYVSIDERNYNRKIYNQLYAELNEEEIKMKKKIYYDRKNEEITCECGSIIKGYNIKVHKRTIKHINYERDFTQNDYIFPEKPSFVITMN
jgi:group I intron endonuclease